MKTMTTTKTREILTVNKISSEDVYDMPHDPIRDLTHRVMEEQVVRVAEPFPRAERHTRRQGR